MSQKCFKVYQYVSNKTHCIKKLRQKSVMPEKKMKKEALRIEGPLQICRGFLCVLHNFIQVLLGKMTNANYFLTA